MLYMHDIVRVITMNTKAYCTVRTVMNLSKIKYQNRSKIEYQSTKHLSLLYIQLFVSHCTTACIVV